MVARLGRAPAGCATGQCRCSTPIRPGRSASSARCPEHYEAAVGSAVELRIRAGALDKIVLAREVQVHAPGPPDVPAVLGVLREAFPACHLVCAARGDSAFIAASPELLLRREGAAPGRLALAGSTRRSADGRR